MSASRELSIHAAIEEKVIYPAARVALDDDAIVLESLQEHLIVKWELAALADLDPSDEPPGNLVAGAAALVDRARDGGERAVTRVRQEIAS